MKCQDVSEFVSALYDGEKIPKDAAEHVGICDDCRELLNAYSAMGNELRRLASVEADTPLRTGFWRSVRRAPSTWWRKGFATMKIPRIAFASMFIAILALSGGLVLGRARTGATGPVLILTYRPIANGRLLQCVITTDTNRGTNHCTHITSLSSGSVILAARFVSKDNNRTEVGLRTRFIPRAQHVEGDGEAELRDVPEQVLSFDSGESRQIEISGMGEIELTGNYLDHIPTLINRPDEALDPQAGEFRVVAPVLIRDKQVIVSMDGTSIWNGTPDAALMLYVPGEGRYLISAAPFEGAVEGSVHLGQVEFALESHKYLLLTSMPITRSERMWIAHEPDFKPSERMVRRSEARDDRPMFLVRNLEKLQQPRISHF